MSKNLLSRNLLNYYPKRKSVVICLVSLLFSFLNLPLFPYQIPDGSLIRWRCVGGNGAVVATTILNKSAGNPFGAGPGGVNSPEIYALRYGNPPASLCNGSNPTFMLYAESKDSFLEGWMHDACEAGDPAFVDQKVWDCWPGPNKGRGRSIESEDYAAVVGVRPGASIKPGEGGSTSSVPGIPAITSVSSPGPGLVAVSWRTRANQAYFLVQAGNGFRQIPGSKETNYNTIVELPPNEGGNIEVTVRASTGGPLGRPSQSKFVNVEPKKVEDGRDGGENKPVGNPVGDKPGGDKPPIIPVPDTTKPDSTKPTEANKRCFKIVVDYTKQELEFKEIPCN